MFRLLFCESYTLGKSIVDYCPAGLLEDIRYASVFGPQELPSEAMRFFLKRYTLYRV